LAANYDNSAWFYDHLSRVVFGNALITATGHFLNLIPPNSKVLIAGGGSGRITEDICKIHQSGLQITYVELSAKMMALSRKRNPAENTISYINAPIEDAGLPPGFDVLITPFLLDSLSPAIFEQVIGCLDGLLLPGGIWINTDFQLTGKWWQSFLLKTMFTFFKVMGCVEVTRLPLIKESFVAFGYGAINVQTFYGDFIVSTVYRKP